MQLEAPGTFHHSLVVAALPNHRREIGANAPMCRVCSYFHDLEKLKKPGYFIENQHEGTENPHDTLTPTMSSLIIIAHVKDGVDLAVKNKLNPRIIDVIQEHHGDSLVYFFYRRAQEQKKTEMDKVDRRIENPEDLPVVEEKNSRLPGPAPQLTGRRHHRLGRHRGERLAFPQKTHPGENPLHGGRPRPRQDQ